MRFTITDELPHPLELVYEVHRDKLEELVEYLPNVETVERVVHRREGHLLHVENLWSAPPTEVPALLRPLIKAEYLTWTDKATWDDENKRNTWSIEITVLPGALTAKGENIFREEDGETIVDITGEFIIHPERIPGVPAFMAKRAAPALEKFIVNLIQPNLRRSNAAVVEYIDDHY